MLTLFDNINTDITPELEKKVPSFLKLIKSYTLETPIKSRKIEGVLNIKGIEVRAIVRYLRRYDYQIGSSQKGYFWIQSKSELEKTIKHLSERRDSLQATILELNKIKIIETNLIQNKKLY